MLSSGDISDLLDPSLDVEHDDAEVRRMASAACLCLRRSARLRPPISQVSQSDSAQLVRSFSALHYNESMTSEWFAPRRY